MTNSEIIDVLDDITWNGCDRYEKEVMIECRSAAISALEENDKLKAEIEQLKSGLETYCKLYLASIYARQTSTECIEQLKSELEQLSEQYSNVESLYHKYYNLYKKGQVAE